jgi:hypothetical protein
MPAAYFCIKAFSETDFTEDLKAFDVQTLILHRDDDQIVPQASDDDRDGYDHPASSAARLLMRTDFFPRFLLLLPALLSAMATACFCGLPAFISVLMFELIVLWEDPFLRGMLSDLSSLRH